MKTAMYLKTPYSLLSSLCPIKELVETCKAYGYQNLVISDTNVLSGVLSFKKECESQGIKPIYGMEVEIDINGSHDHHLLIAKNDEGFLNLMKLSSYINDGHKVLDLDYFKEHRSHLYVIAFADDCMATVQFYKKENVEEKLLELKSLIGDFVLALADYDKASNVAIGKVAKMHCQKLGIRTVALNRTYFIHPEDERAFHVLKCIKDKTEFTDPATVIDPNRYLLKAADFNKLYEEEECKEADLIAQNCNVQLAFKTSLPLFKTPNGVSSKDYLINLCKVGLLRRLKGHKNALYEERLYYELKTIINMHFEDYFLIVYDFILYAKKNGILVGPGRGSAAGSLVSYCLGITDIDPIRYGLLFERFLNPERISMPDIDVDFPDDKRDEVIQYVKNRYGTEHVAHIITYGTLKAKQALRDVGRVLAYPNYEIDTLSKLIPFDPKMTLMKAYEGSNIFRQKIESEERFRELFKTCLKIEGLLRHESTHAAGIVMSKAPLSDIIPLVKIEEDLYSTQYTMEHLESFGLIKMDFLGLRNLSIINEVVEELKENGKDFNLSQIPLNDSKTFKLIQEVNTLGIFQLESSGMQNLIRRFKPNNFEEIALTIALFRPGPMENIPLFIENRAHPEKIHYLHKDLKPILEETFGIIVYQEQIMMIAQRMAGFSFAKADILRKAMSKKKADELVSLEADFIQGCIQNHYDEKMAKELYELILKFANYGFNKSHSIAYGLIAYQMAYLKANEPLYFYKALLNGVIGSETKTYEYLLECQNIALKIKGPSINYSTNEYQIVDDAILMPLNMIKEVGVVSVKDLLNDRLNNGLYTSYTEAVSRLTKAGIAKNVLENLIHAGAFDEFKMARAMMVKNLATVIKYADTYAHEQLSITSFDATPDLVEVYDQTLIKAEKEKEVLGFYFSLNPILEVKKKHHIQTLPFNRLAYAYGYQKGFGMITRVKQHRTKKGDWMAFVSLADETKDLDLVVMPNLYRIYQNDLQKGKYLYFEGTIEKEASCLAKKIEVKE